MSDAHAHSVAFVRDTEIPPAPPPVAEAGAVKWMKDNLFSGVANTVMTVIGLLVVFWLLSGLIPWIVNGTWEGGDIRECREILAGSGGGCFTVIAERWPQLLFGFEYPADLRWRPTVAFLLLFVAVPPALFPMYLPRWTLTLTGLYPFAAFWLIWGGSLSTPIVALAGFMLGYWAYKAVEKQGFVLALGAGVVAAVLFWFGPEIAETLWVSLSVSSAEWPWAASNALGLAVAFAVFWALHARRSAWIALLLGLAVAVVWWAAVTPILGLRLFVAFGAPELVSGLEAALLESSQTAPSVSPPGLFELQGVESRNLGGFMLNMILGVVCVSLSIPLGIVLALGRQSRLPIVKGFCVVFIEFVRGVPLITLLFVANVVLAYFLPPEANFDLIIRVIIMITMFSAAYIAEVIRGGLAALPKGQYEAADSLGLDYPQAMRLIILPQALKISIPGIVNVAVGLFKDTTLVSVISMFDLVGMIRGPILSSTDWTGVYWELWAFACVLFFTVCYGISQYSQWLERQLTTDRH